MPSTDMGVPTPIMPRHGAEEIEINYYAFGVSTFLAFGGYEMRGSSTVNPY